MSGRTVRLSGLALPSAQCAERRAQLFGKQLRLFPGGEVASSFGFVEVDQVVVGLLGPAARRVDVLLREHRDGGREGDVGGALKFRPVTPSCQYSRAADVGVLVSQ